MNNVTAIRQETWPALSEMGITRFHEIAHYSLRQDGDDRDVLKISYKRQKGSLLPESRKYRFGRSLKTIVADGGTARLEDTYEISPYLLNAVAELDRLVTDNALVDADSREAKSGFDRKATLLVEINHIERTLGERLGPADAGTIAAKFADVRRQIEAL